MKEAIVFPLLKKLFSDPYNLASYCPVFNLAFLGKVIERVVAEQLQDFLDETFALNLFQSSFCSSHGTEMV